MTRINVIEVKELCDQHLLAEHRELTRIPNCIISGKYDVSKDIPTTYLLGTGHVTFFYNKLKWLKRRYEQLHQECINRGFDVVYKWPDHHYFDDKLWNDYEVSDTDVRINRDRISERKPENARYYGDPL